MVPLRNSQLLAAILLAAASTLGALSIATTIYLPNFGPPPPVITASPIGGLKASDLHDSFNEIHHGHRHEAIDIMKPYGTPVHAVVDGTIRRLFMSRAGGTTIYQFDTDGSYCYYYARLDRCGRITRRYKRKARTNSRLRGDVGQRCAWRTAVASRDHPAGAGQAMVARHADRSVSGAAQFP
jgi:hypothetical protein